jgi:hypothetical protein
MNKLIVPYAPEYGNPNTVFSEPQKLGQPEKNSMEDLTEAVQYYFEKILKLSVIQNNTKINVPVIYGTPENWKSVQDDGYYRDQTGKMFAPLIMYKRTSTTPNRGLGNKLDGNKVHNVQLFEKRWNSRNNYGNFTVLAERTPEKEYVVAITPDYVTIEFECMMWTYLVEQMDKLIEILNFSSRSYWGDPNRFQFYSQIETFNDDIAYEIGEDRAVMTRFNLTLNGYLIPESVNKSLANSTRYFGASQVLFGMEVASNTAQQKENMKKPQFRQNSRVLAADSINNLINVGGVDTGTLQYLLLSSQIVGSYVNATQAIFGKGWAVAPTSLPNNNIDNFTFFVNGQHIEKTAITTWQDNGNGTSTLIINPSVLKFSFDPTDLIIAIGKFQP